jgi:ribosomal protein S18 acetylase RimI-like enzyme
MNLIRVDFSPIRRIKTNDEIDVNDLILVRQSYGLSPEEIESTTIRYLKELAEKSNRLVFVEYDTLDAPVAYVQLVLKTADKDPDLSNGFNIAHVYDLRVKRELQGRGYGRKLMKHLEKAAEDRGIRLLTLAVDSTNFRAIDLYKILGYKKFKTLPGHQPGELIYYMQKLL